MDPAQLTCSSVTTPRTITVPQRFISSISLGEGEGFVNSSKEVTGMFCRQRPSAEALEEAIQTKFTSCCFAGMISESSANRAVSRFQLETRRA